MPNPLVRWWNVTNDKETRIGKVRSAIHSPTLGTNIGLAMIDHPHDATGGTITIHPRRRRLTPSDHLRAPLHRPQNPLKPSRRRKND